MAIKWWWPIEVSILAEGQNFMSAGKLISYLRSYLWLTNGFGEDSRHKAGILGTKRPITYLRS